MSLAAFKGRQVESCRCFALAINLGQRETTFLAVNKHWTPFFFHGRNPIPVVRYLTLFCVDIDSVTRIKITDRAGARQR
jgi:hypothetical protein